MVATAKIFIFLTIALLGLFLVLNFSTACFLLAKFASKLQIDAHRDFCENPVGKSCEKISTDTYRCRFECLSIEFPDNNGNWEFECETGDSYFIRVLKMLPSNGTTMNCKYQGRTFDNKTEVSLELLTEKFRITQLRIILMGIISAALVLLQLLAQQYQCVVWITMLSAYTFATIYVHGSTANDLRNFINIVGLKTDEFPSYFSISNKLEMGSTVCILLLLIVLFSHMISRFYTHWRDARNQNIPYVEATSGADLSMSELEVRPTTIIVSVQSLTDSEKCILVSKMNFILALSTALINCLNCSKLLECGVCYRNIFCRYDFHWGIYVFGLLVLISAAYGYIEQSKILLNRLQKFAKYGTIIFYVPIVIACGIGVALFVGLVPNAVQIFDGAQFHTNMLVFYWILTQVLWLAWLILLALYAKFKAKQSNSYLRNGSRSPIVAEVEAPYSERIGSDPPETEHIEETETLEQNEN